MSRTALTATVVLAALALPTAAAAETSAFSEARRGDLRVFSSVIVTRTAVDLMGGWLNDARPCTAERRLRVTGTIYRTRGNTTGVTKYKITRRRANCAEGGPNLGFQIEADETEPNFACANGSWKPGRYDFITKTKHLGSDVVSVASLSWVKRRTCA